MKNMYVLEWHSRRTGKEGIDYEEGETPADAMTIYESRYPMREVKAILDIDVLDMNRSRVGEQKNDERK